jgi:hypothetical protein
MPKRRMNVSFSAELHAGATRRKQTVTAVACLRQKPDTLDKLLNFDSIPADFLPLDTFLPYVESKTPPCIGALSFRAVRKASTSVSVAISASARRRGFYFSSPLRLTGSGTIKTKITGRGHPHEKTSALDDFLRFDSIPADFVPLDSTLPYREGRLLWR